MQSGSPNAVGTPYKQIGSYVYTPTTYSCVPDCTGAQYEVHMIGMYSKSPFNPNTTVEMTAESLQYLINRFGTIASFSGTYDAGRWVLDIQRENGSSNSELCLWQLGVKATNLHKVIS